MSHIVTIKTEVRDAEAVKAACRRLGLPEPVHGTARLFEGEATGLLVRLPGWLYPAVVRHRPPARSATTTTSGQWGDPKHLDAFLQAYADREGHDRGQEAGPHASSSSPSPTAPSS